MGAPQVMHRREGEDERHHRAFLLYAMQEGERRSLRAVARALNASDNSVRKWRQQGGWHKRLDDPEHCRHACDLYAELYHRKLGGRDIAIIKENLGAEYVPPDEAEKSRVARAVDLYEQVDREEAMYTFQREANKRNDRLRKVLDGTMARVAQGIASNEIKVKPSDLGTVIRGYELLERSETRRLSMMPTAGEGEGNQERIATSQRVLQAQARGTDVLAALEADAEELLLVLRTLRAHEEESNVARPLATQGAAGAK